MEITNYRDKNLFLCFIFLAISFGIIITNIIKTINPNKLKIDKDLVTFREDDELPLFNKVLYLENETRKASYIVSLVSISFSLFSLINYSVTNEELNFAFFLFYLIVAIPCFAYFVSSIFIFLRLINSDKSLIRDYVKTNLPKILTRNKDVIIVLTVSLTLTFFFKTIFKDNNIYAILPIWFLFSGMSLNCCEDYTQIKNPIWIMLLIGILVLAITLIIFNVLIAHNKFQVIGYLTLFASIYIFLLKCQHFPIKKEK